MVKRALYKEAENIKINTVTYIYIEILEIILRSLKMEKF